METGTEEVGRSIIMIKVMVVILIMTIVGMMIMVEVKNL